MLAEDRDYMYCTLRAAFEAAAQSDSHVLVLSDFGCDGMGHPPQEVASLMYKLAYEFVDSFKAIFIAIAPKKLRTSGARTNFEELQRIFQNLKAELPYWGGEPPHRSGPSSPWKSASPVELVVGDEDSMDEEVPQQQAPDGGVMPPPGATVATPLLPL